MTVNNRPKRWEVWLAKVKFEDKPQIVKRRPVIVFDDKIMYILSFKVTGQPPRDNMSGEYALKKWSEAGLDTESTVRLSQQIKLVDDDFVCKIGTLATVDIMGMKMILLDF